MSTQLRVSVVVIGDEILGGFVADTNSGFIAARLQALGVPLERVVTVPDEVAAIDEALQTELARARPRLVLTSGGLGSTPDDLTLTAVAVSLGRDLVVQPRIDRWISASIAGSGTPPGSPHARSMRKMALVPAGARLLPGARGVAPGVALDVDGGCERDQGATVVVLPGVPSELRRIMTGGVEPTLLAGRGRPQHVAEVTHGYPESMLNPVLNRLVADFPDVHLGSYPDRECVIRLKGPRERVEQAAAEVRAYLRELDGGPRANSVRAAWQARWS